MSNTGDLIVKAMEKNLPMQDLYDFKGYSKNIITQTGELIMKFEPIINEMTDSKINIPCMAFKLNEKLLCKDSDSLKCKIGKTNRELACKPLMVIKDKISPLLKTCQTGGYNNSYFNRKSTKNPKNIKKYKEIYKIYCN